MNIFDKTTKAVKEVGTSIGNVTREQTELANLKIQKAAIERKLEGQYAEIGKRYVAYISDSYQIEPFDVSDILDVINPDLERVAEISEQMELREQQVRQNALEKERKKAQEQFDIVKKKLDKARDMDVISDEEYNDKLEKAQRRLDNFEVLKKIQMQYEMDIITREEYQEKVNKVLQIE